MWKPTLLLAFLVLINVELIAQKLTIHGYVTDDQTGETVGGATVTNIENNSSTITNSYGYFSLIAKIGKVTMISSYLGFQTDTVSIFFTKDTLINVRLKTFNQQLKEISVSSTQNRHLELSSSSSINISTTEVESMPRLAGEVDLVKAVQMLPGVKSGREGSSDYYVRGGGAEQNLVLLDGVPIYHSSHALGFFSVFNTDAIKNVELLKGGFPARYGGRLSSVLDIKLKEGNEKSIKYAFSAGILSSKLLIEGPLKKEQTTFLFAVRRTYLDLLAALAQPTQVIGSITISTI